MELGSRAAERYSKLRLLPLRLAVLQRLIFPGPEPVRDAALQCSWQGKAYNQRQHHCSGPSALPGLRCGPLLSFSPTQVVALTFSATQPDGKPDASGQT